MRVLLFTMIMFLGFGWAASAQTFAVYYPNDRVKAFYSLQDDGIVSYTKYTEDAEVLETGFYIAMKKTGTWKYYDTDGHLRMQLTYVDGKREGVCYKWDATGALEYRIVYNDDVRTEAVKLDVTGVVVDSRHY